MYFTHHFARPETLARAHSWLTQVGFDPGQTEMHTAGIPRIVMVVEPRRLSAVQMLINVAERSDPDGFPSFWDEARQPHSAPTTPDDGAPNAPREGHPSVIGWHPID